MIKRRLLLSICVMLVAAFFNGYSAAAAPSAEGEPPYLTYLPIVSKPPPPAPPETYSTSRYMMASQLYKSWNYGCEAGYRDAVLPGTQDSVVILFYGKPKYVNGKYGTYAYGAFVDTTQISNSVKEYARGYWECSGNDTQSIIEIAVGTSNLNYEYWADGICQGFMCSYQDGYDHGKAWALLVKDLDLWIRERGYASQIRIAGGADIELAWNTPTVSHGWADGFNANDENYYIFYNFGTCDGCPTRISPTWNPMPPWTMWDIYYTAWYVAPVWPIPEIYANSGVNARQWAYLSHWGATNGLWKIDFSGSLTQFGACQGSSDTTCEYLDNTPEEGWQQLYEEINYWPITAQPELRWMTDIRWP